MVYVRLTCSICENDMIVEDEDHGFSTGGEMFVLDYWCYCPHCDRYVAVIKEFPTTSMTIRYEFE